MRLTVPDKAHEDLEMRPLFSLKLLRSRGILFSFEFGLILGILCAAGYLTFLYQKGTGEGFLLDLHARAAKAIVFVLACQVCMYMNELYDPRVFQSRRELGIRLLQALGVACIIQSAVYAFWTDIRIGQMVFLTTLPSVIAVLFFWRLLYTRMLTSEALAERVVILGNDASVEKILSEVADGKERGFYVTTLVTENTPERAYSSNPASIDAVISLEDFVQRAEKLVADRVVVAIQDRRGRLPFRTLLNCRFRGIQVEEAASFYETLTGKILLDRLRPSWFIFSEGFRISKFTLRLKMIFDLAMAGVLLVVTLPVILLTAVLIKLDSKGPVIYKQDRVGQGWREYTLYKFRSMVEDAEASGIQWAEQDDPRVTRVGRVLRRFRIDELPQLWNVFRGDMSFVGPRPERRFFVDELSGEIPYYPYRLFVKPGISGWAQVKYHYGASRDETMEKLQYDLYYIKHMSFFFDLSILFDTIRVVLSAKGSR